MSGQLTRIEPATTDDLDALAQLLGDLFSHGVTFEADPETQKHGLRLILESPAKGRIFVLRTDHKIIGMVNLLFTISTAEGGPVILMEDLVIHPDHRGQGFGGKLLEYVKDFAKRKAFRRITLLTDDIATQSLQFFMDHGFEDAPMTPMRLRLRLP
jgi:N-acetylglutamate synthase-like GNAT family acetyltransferase